MAPFDACDVRVSQGAVHGEVHDRLPLQIIGPCDPVELRCRHRRRPGSIVLLTRLQKGEHGADGLAVPHAVRLSIRLAECRPHDPDPAVRVASLEAVFVDLLPQRVATGPEVLLGQRVEPCWQGDVLAELPGHGPGVIVRPELGRTMQAIQIKVACIRDGLDDEFLTGWVGRGYHHAVAYGPTEVGLAGMFQKPLLPKGLGFVQVLCEGLRAAGVGVRDGPDTACLVEMKAVCLAWSALGRRGIPPTRSATPRTVPWGQYGAELSF